MDTPEDAAAPYHWSGLGTGSGADRTAVFRFLLLWGALALATVWVYVQGRGATLWIDANVKDVQIFYDGRGPITAGSALPKTPFGLRHVQARHIDCAPFDQALELGWFSDRRVHLEMRVLPVDLIVRTEPGAEVLIDGAPAGRSSPQGVFRKSDAHPGPLQLTVRLKGYHPWTNALEIHPPNAVISAYLAITPERATELAQQREAVLQLLSRAEGLFSSRQYREALGLVEQALTIDPQDGRAIRLREQITQTIKILGQD